ncbi:MarR family transcriptional regulator [Chitinophagaceae bacterium LB-8]|uniref:MarR family transcriptional regulator n=1 Tax=Paraflavisolibacter caeni TaxID=2982496 RepID=A0A9X2XSX6_9BACT|nr:MarR family transcriptional regulator [Paraflavisolibacter caeni]MCU7547697.1 MarR family transcriptional regulator [Paraflavisolibacter caeni]
MEKLEGIIFYTIDKAIKTYRQFAQKRLYEAGLEITIDQWLVMQALTEKPDISQNEIAEKVFKDAASVTRIIDLLIKKKYLERKMHDSDRRRFHLEVTSVGKTLMKDIAKVVAQNRAIALHDVTQEELGMLRDTLTVIINNCKTN